MDLFQLELESLQRVTLCTHCDSSKTFRLKLNQIAVNSIRYSLFECLDCGFWFSPKQDGDAVDYSGYDQILTIVEDNSNVDRYLKKLHNIDFSEFKSVLEIGCARGEFLLGLKSLNTHLHLGGLEINQAMCNTAQSNGVDCFINQRDHIQKYDVIIANHVIEHFNHSNEFLELCEKLGTKNHSLILNFPNKKNVWTKRGMFPDLHLPFHRFYYSVAEVSLMLKKHGYSITIANSTESGRYFENSKQCRYNSLRGNLDLYKSVVNDFPKWDSQISKEYVELIEKEIDRLDLGSEGFIYATKIIR